ncbi:hypothetical protein LAJ55_14520, partial [Streptococcus pneumoniae]|uniref:hypothetical protein n=1 Tax=Streptococcus pneumoniae TaxID=1313 RepID=UPI001CBC9548
VTHHRAIWLEKYLDDYLDVKWKRDLSGASRDYQELTGGRGRPPTLRQAFPKLNVAAKRWFGGDIAKLARSLDMEGPVAELTMRRS